MTTLYRRGRVWSARGSVDGKPIKARSLYAPETLTLGVVTHSDLFSSAKRQAWPGFESEV